MPDILQPKLHIIAGGASQFRTIRIQLLVHASLPSRIKDGSNKQHANGPHAPAAAMSEFTVNLLCDLDTGG